MFGSCPSNLDSEMPPLRFGFQQKDQQVLWNLLVF